ncbi:hypothetical protein [Luteipulveratus mongoliensis]|uniref:Uncharacterized protein n=1 Tax=Luteipulveratus mongoliensis TaxID=571913 RepID=A0A0K1JDH9_9MICO|nr:hypothetical protein [Luteipulveratus mongoliensis]AKU14663.1 hypothetical protein VV02_00220 [Luteipulveratus mongoliensis]
MKTDEQIGRLLRDELGGVQPRVDIERAVAGGARRARRQTALKVGGLVMAMVLFVGGALVVGTTLKPESSAPMPGSSGLHVDQGELPGCTLKPSTCDGRIPQAWVKKHLGKAGPGVFSAGDGSMMAGQQPVGASATWMTKDMLANVSVSQALKIDETMISYGTKRRVAVSSGIGALVLEGDAVGGWSDEWWLIKEGPGHGAIGVFLTYDTGKRRWTDADVITLINALLNTPPRQAASR